MNWTLFGEFYSMLVLFILYIRYHWYERDVAKSDRWTLYRRCLQLSMASIVVNVLSVLVLDHPQAVPVWANLLVNNLYFLVTIGLCSLYAYLLFDAVLEHVYDKHCLRRARFALGLITGGSVALLAINLFTGLVFSIDAGGLYHRGPLNAIYYFLPVVEVVLLLVCYIRNRSSVGDRMRYVLRTLPPAILLLFVLQFTYPNILLNGTLCAIVSLIVFIAFRSHTEERDSITGAGSRKAFMEELNLRCGTGQSMHLIQIAMLNMADLNLRYGYTVGNALLYEISRYLRRSHEAIRVFRTGSTAFTVMLPFQDDAQADLSLHSIDARLREGWQLGEILCQPTFAISEMRSRQMTGHPSELAERLEYATSLAKEKQLPIRYDRQVEDQFRHRANMIRLIEESIQQDRFRVVYQPVYCCHRSCFCSSEALLRLSARDGTPISPSVFIPLAEEAGLIDRLTWIVLDQVCRMLSREDLPGLESVSFNLSMQQFLDPRLPRHIADYLDRYRLDHSRLRVEITERFILHDAEYARRQLSALEDLGIQIYMDDFGTGYSNLSGLLAYPFSAVKLDRSLILPINDNAQAALMVDTLIRLFRELGKIVLAEGVEDGGQVAHLTEKGVDMIQGFYYARPVTDEQLPDYFGDAACKNC